MMSEVPGGVAEFKAFIRYDTYACAARAGT
jgi:hypothetical protein